MTVRRIMSDGVELSVVDEGSGPAVLMLHGFPDSSALWRNQIPALVDAGFRVIAPDQRGFGDSDKPEGVESYAANLLVQDAVAVLDACGVERAHVVGHDWGAVVAWLFTMLQPARVERLVALSVGAPGSRRRWPVEQLHRSWYMFAFQFPAAEDALQRNGWELMREWVAGTYPDLERAIEDLSRPGALTAGLNWYRANARPDMMLGETPPFPRVAVPVMGIWSSGDVALTEAQMTASASLVDDWRYERIDGVGHWIPLDAPDELNRFLLDFLKA